MPTDPVEITAYDPAWGPSYEAAASELREALGDWLVAIEHIGSTAVPGLAAKPVIDIMAGVTSLDRTPEIVAAVERLGYEYVPEFEAAMPNRRYFRRWSPEGVRTHQIHLVERADTDWWDRHLVFRDQLRTNASDREEYARLKRRLAATYRHDRDGYTHAKSAFIAEVVRRSSHPE